jgi:urea transporter
MLLYSRSNALVLLLLLLQSRARDSIAGGGSILSLTEATATQTRSTSTRFGIINYITSLHSLGLATRRQAVVSMCLFGRLKDTTGVVTSEGLKDTTTFVTDVFHT